MHTARAPVSAGRYRRVVTLPPTPSRPSDTSGSGAGNHLALYRKYRSATFAEVIGQEHVTEPLQAALRSGRINHAYLFSGPRGCGKTSSARILARSLNCVQGPTATPCGICDSCRELAPTGAGSIDVIEIDAASHNGVDDARDLRERAFFAPVRDRFKVYIIDEAHMVTTAAFNALLKLVEEPPDFLVFVFATTEPDKVLPTIRSRTHHYPFRLIAPQALRAHLEKICANEGIAVEPAVLLLVVRAGGGSARDSLSILDQLLAGADPDVGVTYSRAVALLGVTDAALLDDMVDALAAGDAPSVYATVDRVVEAGHDPRRFSVDLLDRFRDLILLDAVPDAADRGLIDVPQDQLNHMADQAVRLGVATLTRCAEIVHTALIEMRGTTSPRLVLELLCARMLLPDASSDAAALLHRLERLERRITASAGSASAAASAQPVASRRQDSKASERASSAKSAKQAPTAPTTARSTPPAEGGEQSERTPPAGALDTAALRRLWPEVLDVVRQASRRTRALLDNAQIIEMSGDQVRLSAPAALAKMIAEDSNTSALRAALTKVVGGKWKIAVSGAPSAAGPETAAAEPDPRDEDDDPAGARRGTGEPVDAETEALRLLREQFDARPLDG
jgi:DNA polymerase-3 subunit gamma/tau